jgi:GNAT superfamily N-acetyltransferase
MVESGYSLRHALPRDFDDLVRIDDDACSLYVTVGLSFDHLANHPFAAAERARWRKAVNAGLAYVAVGDDSGDVLAFATLGFVDGAPYMDQLSVRRSAMRRGLGGTLIERAVAWSGQQPLWLTTYAHVSWNAPFYERHGFARVPEQAHGPELRAVLDEQRAALPAPEQRIAMVRPGEHDRCGRSPV